MLGAVGLSLALPRFGSWLERTSAPLAVVAGRASPVDRRAAVSSAGWSSVAAIGLIWAPCVGPIMAAVIAVAASRGPNLETVAIAVAYVAGAAVPLGLIAGWGRRASLRLGAISRRRTTPALVRDRDAPQRTPRREWPRPGGREQRGQASCPRAGAASSPRSSEQPAVQDGLSAMEDTTVNIGDATGGHPAGRPRCRAQGALPAPSDAATLPAPRDPRESRPGARTSPGSPPGSTRPR